MVENITYSVLLTLESAVVYFFMKKIYINKKINKYKQYCKDTYSEENLIRYNKYLDIKCVLVTISNIVLALSAKTLSGGATFTVSIIIILIIDNIHKYYDISESIK